MIRNLLDLARPGVMAAALLWAVPGAAQDTGAFAGGWVLDAAASELRVMSIKKSNVAESSPFRTFTGQIDADGTARISVLLDSIDTGIDLRNVRMRFLFFETFQYPEATVTATLDPAALSGLETERLKVIDLPYTLDLHGARVDRTDPVQVALIDDNTVVISSLRPIPLKLGDLNLEGGRQKLQEAAEVDIVPVGTVSFRFLFQRGGTAQGTAAAPVSAAIEPEGTFDVTGCTGRFEILSRTENIFFTPGSANLDAQSEPLLNTLLDIVNRCPDMRVRIAGHTDSDGSAALNQRLSEARAGSVQAWLTDRGVAPDRLNAVGLGETEPKFPNDSSENKRRNRRIEFSVIEG